MALTTPIVAGAQSNYAPDGGNLMFGGDQTSNGKVAGMPIGPFKAQLKDFGPVLADVLTPGFASMWCVDLRHQAPSMGGWDTYYATAFDANSSGSDGNGDYSKTRAYSAASGTSAQKNTAANALYQKAAWLIEQYDPTKDGLYGAGLYNATNIQGTIWNLFGASLPPNVYNNFFQLSVASNATPTMDWFVLSDKASFGETASNQEFLTYRARPAAVVVPTEPAITTPEPTITTPEPSTYALMAAGLLGLALVARRRRVVANA